ncbi:MAG TPA: kinase, partial [Caulobacteraceae bacterium]|nr:kinase [Caulobacteraceae bacterium]
MTPDLAALLRAEALPASYEGVVRRLHMPLAARIAAAARAHGPGFRVGLCGPQGSGKTTSARVLKRLLATEGLRAVVLSLDDLYLPLAARRRLAAEVHPLLITRGVPGTHDVDLGLEVLASLPRPGRTMMPRFDKASDDRVAPTPIEGPADVILFEGWCVGARPQDPAALEQPVNDLERQRDPDAVWRAYANRLLAGPYQTLFADFGLLVLFKVASFDVVLGWRQEQERKAPKRGMSNAEVAAFIRHYERLTNWIQAEMPARADVVARLDPDRAIGEVR